MLLGTRTGRVSALAGILVVMIACSASIAAACPGGGEEGGGRRLTASTSQFDFRGETGRIPDITWTYSGSGEIRTIRGGAAIVGREPEDYSISIDECEREMERNHEGIIMRNGYVCTAYGVRHNSTRRSSALLTLASDDGVLISTVRLINS
jgi:hypothetical protein